MPKSHWSAVTENAKNPQVRAHENIPKSLKSAVTEKWQKVSGLRSRKMAKTRRSAVTENAKNSQVRGHGKCLKLAGSRSQKMPKTHRSAFMEICQKTSRFAVTKRWKKSIGQHLCENAKNSHVYCHGKCQKNSQVCVYRRIPKTRRSTVEENAKMS